MTTSKSKESGWSLIELVLATTIMGILGVGSWLALKPDDNNRSIASTEHKSLSRAKYALLGYALVHHRFPYADQSNEQLGTESSGAAQGQLAVRTLGLPYDFRMDYVVDPILAETPSVRFSPPVVNGSITPTVRITPNGLDLCSALVSAQRRRALTADDVPMAYGLLRRTPSGSDEPAPPENITRLPGSYDGSHSRHVAIGASELIQALKCPSRITTAASLSIQSQIAQELPRLGEIYTQYRDMRQRVADAGIFSAWVSVILDYNWLAIELNDLIAAIKAAKAKKVPFASVAVLKIFDSAVTVGRLAAATVLDTIALTKAPGSLSKATDALDRARDWQPRIQSYADEARQLAINKLEKGLLP